MAVRNRSGRKAYLASKSVSMAAMMASAAATTSSSKTAPSCAICTERHQRDGAQWCPIGANKGPIGANKGRHSHAITTCLHSLDGKPNVEKLSQTCSANKSPSPK